MLLLKSSAKRKANNNHEKTILLLARFFRLPVVKNPCFISSKRVLEYNCLLRVCLQIRIKVNQLIDIAVSTKRSHRTVPLDEATNKEGGGGHVLGLLPDPYPLKVLNL